MKTSVNLSAKQFRQSDLAEMVTEVLDETGLAPRGLVLEITESVLMEDVQATAETLRRMKDLGVKAAIDDFATGYSSLSYLKRFPVSYLKIDRSFMDGLGQDPEDKGIVAAVITGAHTLG